MPTQPSNPSADELEALFNIQQAITSRLDPAAVMQLITEAARRLTGSDRASVVLLEGDIFRIAAHSSKEPEGTVIGYRMPAKGSITELAVQSQKPVYIANAPNDPHVTENPGRRQLVERLGIETLMAVPLIAEGRPLGAISISNKLAGEYGPDDERVLMRLASSAVIGLENARLYRQEQERRRVAEGLRGTLKTLNSDRPPEDILAYIVEQAVRLLATGGGAIYGLEPGRAELTLRAAHSLPEAAWVEKPIPLDRGPIGRGVSTRQPVAVSAPEASEAEIGPPYRALLAAPLLLKKAAVYGSLVLYFNDPRSFRREEIELAETLADQAVLAIENARLRQRVKQAAVMRERSRLARDLHDSVTQALYSLTLLTEGWRRKVEAGQVDRVADYLAEAGQIAYQGLKEMRLLIHELRPPALEEAGLVGALQRRLDAVEGRAGVEVRLLVGEGLDTLPDQLEEELYRIAQESLNNALKHAEASQLRVRLERVDDRLELAVIDNGRGCDPKQAAGQGGLGLESIRERAEKLGGRLAFISAPGQGATVKVSLPLAQREEDR